MTHGVLSPISSHSPAMHGHGFLLCVGPSMSVWFLSIAWAGLWLPDNVYLDLTGESLSAPLSLFGPRSHHLKLSQGLEYLWSTAPPSSCVTHTCCRDCPHSPASTLSHMCFVKAYREELCMSVDSPCVWRSQEGFTGMLEYTPVFSKVYLLFSYFEESSALLLLTLHQWWNAVWIWLFFFSSWEEFVISEFQFNRYFCDLNSLMKFLNLWFCRFSYPLSSVQWEKYSAVSLYIHAK